MNRIKKTFIICISLFLLGLLIYFVLPNKETIQENKNDIEIDTITYCNLIDINSNRIVVNGTIINAEGNILIDTGGNENGTIIMDSSFFYNNVDTSNLVLNKKEMMKHIVGYYSGEIPIKIGDISFIAKNILILDSKFSMFDENSNYIAIIGKLFYDKTMRVNFDDNRMTFADSLIFDTLGYTKLHLYPPRRITGKDPKKNEALNENEKYIEIDGFIDKKENRKKGLFLFDTGCNRSLILKSHFGKTLKKPEQYEWFCEPYEKREALWVWKADNLNISNFIIDSVNVEQSLFGLCPGFFSIDMLEGGDGIIGMEIIKKFNFIADFKNNVIYFKPSKYYYEFEKSEIK